MGCDGEGGCGCGGGCCCGGTGDHGHDKKAMKGCPDCGKEKCEC